jgi:hypothetical protein
MWSGADESIAKEMAGSIKIQTAKKTKIAFNGNQTFPLRYFHLHPTTYVNNALV